MSWGAPDRIALVALAPLAVVIGWWWWHRSTRALAGWAVRTQWPRLGVEASNTRLALRLMLLFVAVATIALASARPRWGRSEHTVERAGIDTVVILDSSTSMSVTDVTPSRLEVARALLDRLTHRLEGNRVAVLQMEGTVRALTPMTADMEGARLTLDTIRVNSLERPGTDLGVALERAADIFLPGEERHRAVLLVTDGEDHGQRLDKAERRLADQGVQVHVLAVGTPQGGPVPVPGAAAGAYKQDGQGQVIVSRMAGDRLRQLAQATRGTFVAVERAGADIEPIVQAILDLESRSLGVETVIQQEERFQIPLLAAVLALVAMPLVRPLRSPPASPGGPRPAPTTLARGGSV